MSRYERVPPRVPAVFAAGPELAAVLFADGGCPQADNRMANKMNSETRRSDVISDIELLSPIRNAREDKTLRV